MPYAAGLWSSKPLPCAQFCHCALEHGLRKRSQLLGRVTHVDMQPPGLIFVAHPSGQEATGLIHEDFEFVFMGRAQISNTVYTKETFRTVFVEQVFGPLVPNGFKKVEILYAFGDEENVAVIAEGDADGINGRYNNNYALILKFKDGKIYRINEYASDLLVETALYRQKLVPIE